jgi:plasmid stabilization system protein ParE
MVFQGSSPGRSQSVASVTIELRFAARARKDILDNSIYWATHHPSNPNAFDDELIKVLELIQLFPESGPRVVGARYKHARVRTLTHTGHLLVYRQRGRVVTVLAVLVSRASAERP